jgi:phenylalanyl-tRNA synthetase alpha chain
MKSLVASEFVVSSAHDRSKLVLTAEAEAYIAAGSPEAQAFAAVPPGGCTMKEFENQVGPARHCAPLHRAP